MLSRKVLLDVDPGIDDAVALCLALFEPKWEVVGVTAVGGTVPPDQATQNAQAIVDFLDPPRRPRVGVASGPDPDRLPSQGDLYGDDGLGGALLPVVEPHHRLSSEKLLCDAIRAAPDELTVVALGPLTNIARSLQRDPDAAGRLGQLVMLGGTLAGPGDITPAAEFNVYADAHAARAVLKSATTKTLVPLDVANRVVFTYDLLDKLPGDATRAGRLLRQILPVAFRAYRQNLGLEGIQLHDTVALVAAMHPELFEIEMAAVDVETAGELTLGATVFDRRRVPEWRANVGVAVNLDVPGVIDVILRGLAAAGVATDPGFGSRRN